MTHGHSFDVPSRPGPHTGLRAFADALSERGHDVHTPDLFDGRTFATVDEGFAFSRTVDADTRADDAAALLPAELVYAGFSFGVMSAQRFAQTRPGARGALLFEACVPITGEWAFGPWPDGVPVQIHGMDADEFFVGDGDIDAAREIVDAVPSAELFLYPGDRHLFSDISLPSYDAAATADMLERVVRFLDGIDARAR